MAFTETGIIVVSGAVLGFSHAFEVDHLSAVSAFVARKPSVRVAARFGANWALGHGLTLLTLGIALYGLRLALSPELAAWLERAVGLSLVLVGISGFRQSTTRWPGHHTHRGPFWMGILHGVAGTAAFIGESIAAFSSHWSAVVGFTAAFSLGVLAAMTLFGAVLGGALSFRGLFSELALRRVRMAASLWACALGTIWIFR